MSESTDNIAASLHARIETYRADLIESPPSPSNFDYLLRLFHGAQALIAYGDEAQLWSPSAARAAFARLDLAWSPHRAAEERRRWPALSAAGLAGAGGGA
ncbi:hypothetical protein UFOVP496_44 [uncultured Caudovirales phage]|uniref:Uncharacterized protein n=1 Tax=uncultured Caudovirales phage TaxID=2100421 RepID=A0A6J5MMR3_9CAUD|nr:hypothetical protein UFOVP496_44 [uncultured Caudovirales phage]